MPTVDFASYLRGRRLVSHGLAEQIRAIAISERIQIGRLLLEARAMSVHDVMRVLTIQQDAPGPRFGEIAVREGIIDATQLAAVLARQQEVRMHQIDAVRRLGVLSSGELHRLVVDYVTFIEAALVAPPESPGSPPQDGGGHTHGTD